MPKAETSIGSTAQGWVRTEDQAGLGPPKPSWTQAANALLGPLAFIKRMRGGVPSEGQPSCACAVGLENETFPLYCCPMDGSDPQCG